MRLIRTTFALVLSRIRFDWRRHAVAVVAIAVLMASFLTFNALAAGMHDALGRALTEGDHHRVHLTLTGFQGSEGMTEEAFEALAALPGVVHASPRGAKAADLAPRTQSGPGGANLTVDVLIFGLDAAAETGLVVPGNPGQAPTTSFTRGGYQGRNHTLLAGTWIQGPDDAVATQAAADAGYGLGAQVVTPEAAYTVVGVVAHAPPLTVRGVIPSGHILVDHATQTWPAVGGAYFELEPEFATIHAFTQHLVDAYPAATANLRNAMAELERQHFEEARTQEVLAAAGRLVGLAGAATVFAMSLFLLMGERKAIGTMAAVGFTRARLAAYMNQKLVLLAVAGAAAGAALGALAVGVVPVPAMSFTFAPTHDVATVGRATLQTLAAALAGGLLALVLTIRQDPIDALCTQE